MTRILIAILIMAIVTYIPRAVPLVLFNKEIKSKFFISFLRYIPFAVLGAMTFPSIIYSTGNVTTGIIGLITASILAYFELDLLKVAVVTVGVVYICQFI